jgi:dipeptidyl aminopeptidase/acylaminoacyl peptidase
MLRMLWKSALAALLVFCLTVGGNLYARPFTFEDMIKTQMPSGVAVSPDGGRLAFTVSGRDLETNSSWSKVMLLFVQSGHLLTITAGGDHESSPAWSVDGKSLAIVSDKSESSQIWLVSLDEPFKAEQLTDLATGASSPRFAEDGEHLYFTSRVFPACGDLECNALKLTAVADNPVKARLFTKLMYRHWDHWRDGRVSHVHRVQLDGKKVIDLMNEEGWGVTGSWDVSKGDEWIFYTTKDPTDETLSTNNDIYRFAIADAVAGKWGTERVTENDAYDTHPVFSADGKWVAYGSHERAGFESDLLKLTVRKTEQGSEVAKLAEELDRPISEWGWFPDGKRLWFAVADRGSVSLFTVKRKGGKPKRILDRVYLTGIVLSPDGKSFYATRHSLAGPPELFLYPADGGEPMQLTDFNGELFKQFELATVEDFWWEGADGDKVHGWLLFPPGTSKDKKNPFLLGIHGGPQGAWGDRLHPRWNAQLFAAPGYVTLLANPRGSTGYGQKFTDQISRDWGGRVYEDLMNGVAALEEKGWIDPERMCAAGGSYGGYMANWILGHSDKFRCLISHAGVYDLKSKYGSTDELWFPEWEFGGAPWESADYDKWSPSNFVEKFNTPMLVIHGEHDYRVAVNQAMQLFTALQRRGVPSQYLYFPDETHFVVKPKNSQLWYKTFHGWIEKWIGGS